jgi:hypothetical protein
VKKEEIARIAEALGASRVTEAPQRTLGGPLDMLALRDEFKQRLRSSGGRPTDPAWTLSRQVPFKEGSWTRLQDLASEVGVSGRRVGPAQIAALLIENSLREFDNEKWQETLAASRSTPLLSQPEASEAAGTSYNQFDEWVQRGWIVPAARKGHQRYYSADEIIRAGWLRALAQASVSVEVVADDIRRSDLSARYLVLSNGVHISAAGTLSQLYRALGTEGGHLVIDQLPKRRKLLGLPSAPSENHEEDQVRRVV